MKIVTFNLRCIYDNRSIDGDNVFVERKSLIAEKIHAKAPDVIGFQEATPRSVADLRALLPEYTVLFNPRTADFNGEGLALALKKDSVDVFTLDCFWLSETPHVPASRYQHQSDCPRVCQAALCRSKNGIFRVYNVHLDHIDDEARRLGIAQVLAYMDKEEQKLSAPAFLLGDFNAYPDSGTIALCNEFAAFPLQELTENVGGTFHDFGRREAVKIDYIYSDADTAQKPYTAELWTDTRDGVFLSDHYPVEVTI